MMDDSTILLDREIAQELNDMYMQDPESEGYSDVTERITKLYKLRVDQKIAEGELELKFKQLEEDKRNHKIAEKELELKFKQLEESKKDRRVKILVDVVGVATPVVFNWIWMGRGFKFEETGAYSSQTFKWLVNKFRLTK